MVSLFLVYESQAGLLDKYFEKLGAAINVTQAGSYKDQSAGYYTGGGVMVRQRNTTISPVNFSLPKIGVGCNGLDLYGGSMSFISKQKMADTMNAIGRGIPIYALKLGIKTVAPQVETAMSQVEKVMQDMNALMLDSCQASQQIVGGLWPKNTAASEQICMDSKRSESDYDWFGAREHCKKNTVGEVDSARKKHEDLMVGEYNLVWHVVRKMPDYSGDGKKDIAEFVMSVVGTLISYKDTYKDEKGRTKEQFRVKTIEPRADQKEFVAAYLKGGSTSLLRCDEATKCLNPAAHTVSISNETSGDHLSTMKAKVWHRINDLRTKYIEKANITEDDIGFLNDSVNLPIYKYIQVSAAAGTQFMLQDSAEYIAAAILLCQFEKITTDVLEAIDAIQKIQIEDTAIEGFKRTVQDMRSRLQMMLSEANHGSIESLTDAIKAIEQKIVGP